MPADGVVPRASSEVFEIVKFVSNPVQLVTAENRRDDGEVLRGVLTNSAVSECPSGSPAEVLYEVPRA